MSRRRFFKSFFYINYGGQSYGVKENYGGPAHGETFSVSPFVAGGGSATIELVSEKPWTIVSGASWLTISQLSNRSGTYTITLTAAANEAYSVRNTSFTAKTLDDRFTIVANVSQEARVGETYITISPAVVNMGAVDTYDRLVCYLHHNGTTTQVAPAWSKDNDAVNISNGIITTNNSGETPLSVTIHASYGYEGDLLYATSLVNVAAATVVEYITVSPTTANISATGSTQLAVTYHKIVNGNETTTVVTNSATYASNNPSLSVNGTGLVTANNQGASTATATISIDYGSTSGCSATITAAAATIEKYITVSPASANLSATGTTSLTVTYHEIINGSETTTVVTTSPNTEYSSNNTAITVSNGLVTANNQGSTSITAAISISYPNTSGCSATITAAAATIQRYITVSPTAATIGATGTTSLTVTYHEIINGSETATDVTSSASYSSDNAAITVTGGSVTANNQTASQITATISISYQTYGCSATITAAAATIQRYITVSPQSATIGPFDSQQLAVTYHEVINGNETSGDVTTTASYSSNNTAITVNAGLVTANNRTSSPITATISITYQQDYTCVANVTSTAGTIVETVELVPFSFYLVFDESETLSVTYVKTIDGVEIERTVVTNPALLSFSLSDTDAARIEGMDIINQNLSNADVTETISVAYNGITSNTITAEMLKPGSILYRLDVFPEDDEIKYSDSTQIYANYVTVVNGSDYRTVSVSPSSVSWSAVEEETQYAMFIQPKSSIDANGVLTAGNFTGAAMGITINNNIDVTGIYCGLTGTCIVVMGKVPGVKVERVGSSYNLPGTPGTCDFLVKWTDMKLDTDVNTWSILTPDVSPTGATMDSSNYNKGSQTVTITYGENRSGENRDITLYASGTTSEDTKTFSLAKYVQNSRITHTIEASVENSSLDYLDTRQITVMYYTYEDGVLTGSTNVTGSLGLSYDVRYYPETAATINPSTISQTGLVTNTNTGDSSVSAYITVTSGNLSSYSVFLYLKQPVRTSYLTVTANPNILPCSGTQSQLSAVYEVRQGDTILYGPSAITPTAITWSVTGSNSNIASVSADGKLTVNNTDTWQKYVSVKGSYNGTGGFSGATGKTDVKVQGAPGVINYTDIFFGSPNSATTLSILQLSSAQTKDKVFVYEKYTSGSSSTKKVEEATQNVDTYMVFKGVMQVSSFTCTAQGEKYSDEFITIYYGNNGLVFESHNTTDSASPRNYVLSASSHGNSTGLSISVAQSEENPPVTAYTAVFFASGSNSSNHITSLLMESAETKNKIFVYENLEITQGGSISRTIEPATDKLTTEYALYSGSNRLAVFTCTSTGQKYSDNNITIIYRGTTSGISIDSTNTDTAHTKNYTLSCSAHGNSSSFTITIKEAPDVHIPVTAYTSIFFASGNSANSISTLSMASAATKNKISVFETYTIDGQSSPGYIIESIENANFTLYSGSSVITSFTCYNSEVKYIGNGVSISYNSGTGRLSIVSDNEQNEPAKNFILRCSNGRNGSDLRTADLNITIAEGEVPPPPTYELEVALSTLSVPATGGNITLYISGAPSTSYSATGGPAWYKFTKTNNKNVTGTTDANGYASEGITVTENTSAINTRSGSIMVENAGSGVTSQTFTQATATPVLTVSVSPTPVSETGGTVTLSVTTNPGVTWTASSLAGVPWIRYDAASTGTGSGSITLTVDNNDGDIRDVVLTVTASSISKSATATISQNSPHTLTVYVNPSTASSSETTMITFGGYVDVGATWTATSDSSWFKFVTNDSTSLTGTGTSGGRITDTQMKASTNTSGYARTARVTVRSQYGLERVVEFTQYS